MKFLDGYKFSDNDIKYSIIALTFLLFIGSSYFVWAAVPPTPNLNYASYRGSVVNLTNTLNAIGAENGTCATRGATAGQQYFNYFGLGIPDNSTIHGILITTLQSVNTGSETWTTYLRKSESSANSNSKTYLESNTAACGTSQNVATYGSLTDLWGLSWSADDLNSKDFGVLLSFPAGSNPRKLNWVRVQVNYTAPWQTSTTTLTSTITSTVTSTSTQTNTVNTTQTFNSTTTTTLTSTSTTTLTSTVNSTQTFNSTTTTTLTSTQTVNSTQTINVTSTSTTTLTSTSTFNTTQTFNSTTTTTLTNTTTITAAICQDFLCVDNPLIIQKDDLNILPVIIAAVILTVLTTALLITRKIR